MRKETKTHRYGWKYGINFPNTEGNVPEKSPTNVPKIQQKDESILPIIIIRKLHYFTACLDRNAQLFQRYLTMVSLRINCKFRVQKAAYDERVVRLNVMRSKVFS